jgi:hypothetical protein
MLKGIRKRRNNKELADELEEKQIDPSLSFRMTKCSHSKR